MYTVYIDAHLCIINIRQEQYFPFYYRSGIQIIVDRFAKVAKAYKNFLNVFQRPSEE